MTLVLGCSASAPIQGEVARVEVDSPAGKILQGAKDLLKEPARYDASYRSISYPGGDVAKDRGACTDVLIRAFRNAGHDLQLLIHEDMGKVRYEGADGTRDRNIDHRRVRNQAQFFKRHAEVLTKKVDRSSRSEWLPGDVVCWKLDSGRDHTGIISDRKNAQGLPYVIHNIWQTAEEDVLTKWKIVGHYRYPKT